MATIKLSKHQWEFIGKKAGWITGNIIQKESKKLVISMNIGKRNSETEKLKTISPTEFVIVHCDFWIDAMVRFEQHLPKQHLQKRKDSVLYNWSVEAVEAFKRCFVDGYEPTLEVYPPR